MACECTRATDDAAGRRFAAAQGDYDDDLNNDVYDLRVVIYRFDQPLRRIAFNPPGEGRANDILSAQPERLSG